jgi:asparagine synthase (glutamine-hydrolysing)
LRAQLEAEGFSFETRCDTEVVLNAFLHWGSSCFSRLRGMFAIAIWVRSEDRLILARDRMGIKPLYYCLRVHPAVLLNRTHRSATPGRSTHRFASSQY